jgi:hypothetical protein
MVRSPEVSAAKHDSHGRKLSHLRLSQRVIGRPQMELGLYTPNGVGSIDTAFHRANYSSDLKIGRAFLELTIPVHRIAASDALGISLKQASQFPCSTSRCIESSIPYFWAQHSRHQSRQLSSRAKKLPGKPRPNAQAIPRTRTPDI